MVLYITLRTVLDIFSDVYRPVKMLINLLDWSDVIIVWQQRCRATSSMYTPSKHVKNYSNIKEFCLELTAMIE